MGIDFREDPARGAAFAKKAGITYPRLSDESGVLILALQGKAPTVADDPRARHRRAGSRPGSTARSRPRTLPAWSTTSLAEA